MKEIQVKTGSREEFVDITSRVEALLNGDSASSGSSRVGTIYVPHTTAAVTINESADPTVQKDILEQLRSIVPPDGNYRHAEGNSDAHIKSSLIGNTAQVLVEKGSLQLGTWQGVFFCEFDGPRSRKVWFQLR
ncbi:MAG: secondary thiamine-phosphate synthase enzyme YjbQ [Candidatus Acetothermia bacterium]